MRADTDGLRDHGRPWRDGTDPRIPSGALRDLVPIETPSPPPARKWIARTASVAAEARGACKLIDQDQCIIRNRPATLCAR